MLSFLAFGKKRRRSTKKSSVRKPPASLLKLCKKYRVKTTKKVGNRRVYKKVGVLKKQLKRKMSKRRKTRKLRKARFGNGGNPPLAMSIGEDFCSSSLKGVLGMNSSGLFPSSCGAFGRRRRSNFGNNQKACNQAYYHLEQARKTHNQALINAAYAHEQKECKGLKPQFGRRCHRRRRGNW